jgi:hypothetical protein
MFPDLMPGKHLLLDHATVADSYRLRRRVHQPKREPPEPVLTPDRPWEGVRVTPIHVVFDAQRRVYRMWYSVWNPAAAEQRKALRPGLAGNVGEPQPSYVCYAESRDGVQWQRPDLRIYPEHGGANNICFKGFSEASGGILHRPDAPPEDRYVMANLDWFSMANGGVCFAYSPDGIHWAYRNHEPAVFGCSDTFNCLLYSPERKAYMLYMRAWHSAAVDWITDWVGGPGRPRVVDPVKAKAEKEAQERIAKEAGLHPQHKNTRRRVAYAESADLKKWTESQIILTPDELDTDDFYAMQPFRYADYYLGQLWVYDDVEAGTIHTELTFSRDAFNWSRLPDRQKFIPTGEPGDPDGFMVFPAQQPVVVGDDVYVYWCGEDCPHDVDDAHGVTYRGRLRMDGFISLQADRRLGALITRPFVLQGERILINAATHGGEIVAELAEPYYHEVRGKPVEGFTADEFDVFRGDSIAHTLSWRGRSDLSALRGRRLMLRMSLYHADIYSITL